MFRRLPVRAVLNLLRSWTSRYDDELNHWDVSAGVSTRHASIRDARHFKVINTTTGAIEVLTTPEPFAALSYVWGTAPSSAHGRNNASADQPGVPDYAPALRDAAQLAKVLDINWLWVDRVCIE